MSIQRIFTYSTFRDTLFLIGAAMAQVGTCTLSHPGAEMRSSVTEAQFKDYLNKQTLHIVYQFIGRWVISYFSVEHSDEKASSIAGEVFGSKRTIVARGAESRVTRKKGIKQSPIMGIQFVALFFAVYATMCLAFWFGFKL
ncbi:unnamed protein product [Diplocarpon coronariae]